MVEFLMIFALGALVTLLGGLMLLPALNARAQRLQRRKLEALFPMSIAEITAERDHVRAEMAVHARRTELRAEATAREKAADLMEIGRRDVQIFRLNETLAVRDATITGLESDLGETRATLAQTQDERAALDTALTAEKAAHDQLQAGHQGLQARFDRTDAQLSDTRQTLLMTQGSLAAAEAELRQKNEALAAMTAAHNRMQALADERQMIIAAAQTRIEILDAEKQDLHRRIADATARIAQLEAALYAAEGDAREARSFLAENTGKLDEARAALTRLESRQLAQQRAIDAARQKAREDRNAAQAASLALVKAEAEVRRMQARLGDSTARATPAKSATATPKPGVAEGRVVRMTRKAPAKEPASDSAAAATDDPVREIPASAGKPHRTAAE